MGDRRFDADNDKGSPDLGALRVRELVDRVSGRCRTGAVAGRAVVEGTTASGHGGPPRPGPGADVRSEGDRPLAVRPREVMRHD